MLSENNLIKTNEKEIAIIMNNFFINITKNLDLKTSKKCTTKDLNSIVSEFDDHISIKKIKEFFLISTSMTLTLKLSLWKMLKKKS